MTDRTFLLRKFPILTYDEATDSMIPKKNVIWDDKLMKQVVSDKPAEFSYKSNLFNLLRQAPEGKNKKIKDVMQIEELLQRVIATKAGEAIILKDSEHLLIKECFEAFDYPISSVELNTMYLDLVNAPKIEDATLVDKKD